MNFSNIDNIDIVVKLLKENNVRDLIISPGGTNIPIIRAVQNVDFFKCYSVVDERSAAYFAIGIYLQKRKTVALICTSAQATRNYVPGLTEAFYKKVPILAITMEKHARFKYQEYMQAPDQTSLPADCVKKSYELPFISDINDYYHSIRVANEAFLELNKNGMGPVQLCIPWLDFALTSIKPTLKSIKRYKAFEIKNEDLSKKNILLVIGEHIPFTNKEIDSINSFCKKTNTVVYANHLSNFKNEYTVYGNLLLQTSNFEDINNLKPDIIISIGGQTGDYPFYLAFSKNQLLGVEHWRICDDGSVVDTYDKLTRIYQGNIIDFFDNTLSTIINHTYFKLWDEKVKSKNNNCNVPFSSVSIAQYLHSKIPNNSIIQFSILNSLRIWNFFELDSSIECYSNVGAFGIDGGLSTLIGQSIATDKLAFMIIGDLSFFYDMNCLSIRHIRNNVRILLINNNGGIEFKLHGEDKEDRDPYIAAANYHGKAKGWAESCGFDYYSVENVDELKKYSEIFVSSSSKPIILEAFVNDYDESAAYLSIINNNKKMSTTEAVKCNIKGSVKGILGDKKYKKIKEKLKGK